MTAGGAEPKDATTDSKASPAGETRGARMLAIRRARMAASPPILRGGYRPFFLGGAIWAALALAVWITVWRHGLTPPSHFDALAWHRHEMLFGFVGAIIAGYMLTAIPNWSGKLPVAGGSLLALFGLWLLARLLVFFAGWPGVRPLAILVDGGFFFVLAAFLLREIFGTRRRNLSMAVMLMVFGATDFLDHAVALGWLPGGNDRELGVRAGIALVVVLISVVGGKLTPSFTRNLIIKRKLAGRRFGQPTRFDRAVVAATAIVMALWALWPASPWVAGLLGLAALAQLARLARWHGWSVVDDPIVIILHIGYLWLPVGMAALALGSAFALLPLSAAIHALTAGAMATMILAVMTRTILGQTGRAPQASRGTVLAYGLVVAGAVVRVFGPLLPLAYDRVVITAAVLWGGGFLVFAWIYGRVLFAPRIDNPYG